MTQTQRRKQNSTNTKHEYDSKKFITAKYLANLSKRVDVEVDNNDITCGDWSEIESFIEDVSNADCINSQETLEEFLNNVDCGAVFENRLPKAIVKVAEEISQLQEIIFDGVVELVFKK